MPLDQKGSRDEVLLEEVLGYLNFSSGTSDPRFLRNLNTFFEQTEPSVAAGGTAADRLRSRLSTRLDALAAGQASAFADATQARRVLSLVFDRVLPAYRQFHRDLLFHQSDADLWRPFFLGRAFEAVLCEGPPWDRWRRIVPRVIARLNDFVGYRPVAVLENERLAEPYEHEWVGPIPLYIDTVGVAAGRYAPVIETALSILASANPDLLEQAWFDLARLDELAMDPRAYDFSHPVSQRPNHQFGLWDPHAIGRDGCYRRFVLQQVTLDALLSRLEEAGSLAADELRFEAAAVLAGTMLMASAMSGSGPDTQGSSTTLATLLPHIAVFRDVFYQQLLEQLDGPHAERLRAEAAAFRQPFAVARQHLNRALARCRVQQQQRSQLARVFASMGYPAAAQRQACRVQAASVRMLSQIDCAWTAGQRSVDQRQLDQLPACVTGLFDQIERAVACGALIDPWNIVGFGGNFSLFPALENSIHDYRAEGLIELMQRCFGLCARAWTEAAACNDQATERRMAEAFAERAAWWDRFATYSVSSVKRLVGSELEASARLATDALRAWYQAGAEAGDIAFWRRFVDAFDSPGAFHLVIESLLDEDDQVAAMALMIQWLGLAERIPLEQGEISFFRLVDRWLRSVERTGRRRNDPRGTWQQIRKFLEYLEANAQHYWQVPEPVSRPGASTSNPRDDGADHPHASATEEDDQQELFSAAYDEVVYRDSTADGIDGELIDEGATHGEFELKAEAQRLKEPLAFLVTVARLWKHAALASLAADAGDGSADVLAAWQQRAAGNYHDLMALIDSVHRYPICAVTASHESLVEYDRMRMIKERMLERIMGAAIETDEANRLLSAVLPGQPDTDVSVRLLRAVLVGDVSAVRAEWACSIGPLHDATLLYVPLSKGGTPRKIVEARCNQQRLLLLFGWLPRLGMLRETYALLKTAQTIETRHPVGPAAVTEFDRLFERATKAMARAVVASTGVWKPPFPSAEEQAAGDSEPPTIDGLIVDLLQQASEPLLRIWLRHSRSLRLSVVEKLSDPREWQIFVDFVKRYGPHLLVQHFLDPGNVRAILHQGVDRWFEQSLDEMPDDQRPRLLTELDEEIPRSDAAALLTLALEAVMENYGEYRDYNATTTQSDRGECFDALVDFLRLRANYDRLAWNLRPLIAIHDVLIRTGCEEAAETWRRSLTQRTAEAADRYENRFQTLVREHGMRLATVEARIAERFVRPLAIDRLCAWVRPSIEGADQAERAEIFSVLEEEVEAMTREPTGAGLDRSAWLERLEEEVDAVRGTGRPMACPEDLDALLPSHPLPWQQIQAQLEEVEEE